MDLIEDDRRSHPKAISHVPLLQTAKQYYLTSLTFIVVFPYHSLKKGQKSETTEAPVSR